MKQKIQDQDIPSKKTEEEKIDLKENVSVEEDGEKIAKDLAQEYLNDLKRCQADFANYKKRQQESQKELAGYLIEKLVMEITPVLDNFHMATAHVPADACNTPWVMGISYIEKQLEKVLEDNGMSVIEVKEGDAFDPNIHEAIGEESDTDTKVQEGEKEIRKEEESPQQQKQQIVKKVLQKGYKIGQKVIRPVKVVVG